MNLSRGPSGSTACSSLGVERSEVSPWALFRILRSEVGARVVTTSVNFFNDDVRATLFFDGEQFVLETPMSDYCVRALDGAPSIALGVLGERLEQRSIRWWERYL